MQPADIYHFNSTGPHFFHETMANVPSQNKSPSKRTESLEFFKIHMFCSPDLQTARAYTVTDHSTVRPACWVQPSVSGIHRDTSSRKQKLTLWVWQEVPEEEGQAFGRQVNKGSPCRRKQHWNSQKKTASHWRVSRSPGR